MMKFGDRALREQIDRLQQENELLRQQASEESHSRLMAEEALGQTEDRLQLALDAAGLASWQWDIAADLVITSARFAQMLDADVIIEPLQEQHWLPRDLLARVLPEDAVALREAAVRAFKQGVMVETQFRLQTPRGIIWIECTGKVVARDMLGRAERMIGINRDVTQRKRAEEAMRAAREEAEAANKAKDQFLAHISHEIRTPLNGVIGMNNLLAQSELTAEQRKYVDLVASSGRALLALVNDVLDYSRFSAGGIVLEQVRFPLRRWLWEAVMPLQLAAQSKGLELKLSAGQDLPAEMVGDPGRMRQIVTNLVSNAIKFTEHGQVLVDMSLSQAHHKLCISISDTGIGIAKDKQAAIFEAFVQADSSTSRRYGGTGLGLAISAQLAKAMDGQITLQSRLSQGSRFSVFLPIQPAGLEGREVVSTNLGALDSIPPAGLPAPPALAQAAKAEPAPAYIGKQALVADDHEVNQLLASKLLERLGFRVTLAADGEQAIEAVLAQKFDVILMDIQMPRMNGWQAAHELRQWERKAGKVRVPIIAVSAHASAADREQALAVGMDGYLSKPLTPEALASALRATGMHQPTPTMPASSVAAADTVGADDLQRARLLQRLGGDEVALREMARAMRRDLRERMGLAHQALQSGDAVALRAQAHALKGALASVTAQRAAAQAKKLEEAGDDHVAAQAAFQALSVEAKRVFDTLKTW
jgi:signal transduction histidine kinase/DNA-binding response OmpR family regulator